MVNPLHIKGASEIEKVAEDVSLFVADAARPTVEYELRENISSSSVACINIRSANLSCFDFGLKTLSINDPNNASIWHFDETLKTRPYMNVITKNQISVISGTETERKVSRLTFSPALNAGEYFTLGCLEVFT